MHSVVVGSRAVYLRVDRKSHLVFLWTNFRYYFLVIGALLYHSLSSPSWRDGNFLDGCDVVRATSYRPAPFALGLMSLASARLDDDAGNIWEGAVQ